MGFYIEALFFKGFGASIINGTFLVTILGLGSTVVIYKIGKELYGKATGLFAAVLFALSPWELVLSRSFFIDVQCLFFSLLCLYVGILAIRKGSVKLSFISGVFFAAALLTKYFAAFMLIPLLILLLLVSLLIMLLIMLLLIMLIPLLIFWLYSKPKKAKVFLSQIITFALPPVLFSLLWYQVVLGKNLLYMFGHSDFRDLNYNGVNVSYSFVSVFLWNYGLGVLFVVATAFSLILLFVFRKEMPKAFRFDIISLATILPILIIDTILGAGLNLKAPYNNAIKYDYFALPFFCLIAASLAGKCLLLLNLTKLKPKLNKNLIIAIVIAGGLLLAATIYGNFVSAHHLSTSDFLLFRVRLDQLIGYFLLNYAPINQDSLLLSVQYLGFAVLLSGLLWASRHKLRSFFASLKPAQSLNETKNAKSSP